jgi:putative oxidoreductase
MNLDIFKKENRIPVNLGKLVLRLTFGLTMMTHGKGKLVDLFSGNPIEFPDPLGVGAATSLGLTVFAEFVCSALVAIGLLTRLSAVPVVICMAVAFFVIHAADPFGDREHAFIFMMGFLAIFLLGGGRYSIDNFILKKK